MATDRTLQIVEEYLSNLRRSCSGVPPEEREEFISEIHSHLLERIELSGSALLHSLESILEATGHPQELAAQLKTQQVLRKASQSVSPWFLLRAMVRTAATGIAGFLSFLLAVAGYGCALACALTFVLKPLFPDHIGLWLGAGYTLTLGYWDGNVVNAQTYGISIRKPFLFVLGTLGPDGPVHELAGSWVYLIAVTAFVVFLGITTVFSRWAITRLRVQRPAKVNPRRTG
jgi:uncharacterized membrane protein